MLFFIQQIFQRIAFAAIVLSSITLLSLTIMAAIGVVPWLAIKMNYDGLPIENAGMIAQIILTTFMIMMCFFLPGNARIMRLENSHRSFTVGM